MFFCFFVLIKLHIIKMKTALLSLFVFYSYAQTDFVIKPPEAITIQVKLGVFKPKTTSYDPSIVDWSSVIAGCRASCRYERRLCNFYVRAAAHDSLTISEGYGGADGSLLLTQDEIRRQENRYDDFSFILSKNALALAKRYNSSVADVIAVCGAVATEFLGGPKIIDLEPQNEPFLVGRFDKVVPNPTNQLAPSNMDTLGFSNFAQKYNLTIDEMTALMGSHSLIDDRGCERTNGSHCDPTLEPCVDLRMFRWSNKYYRDVCSPNVRINQIPRRSTFPLRTFQFLRNEEICKFTSPEFRKKATDEFEAEVITLHEGELPQPQDNVIEVENEMEDVTWSGLSIGVKPWIYTLHDAWMGNACSGKLASNPYNNAIKTAMNTFKDNSNSWDQTYIRAYKKMMNLGADFGASSGFAITGDECPSGYASALKDLVLDCSLCYESFKRNGTYNCPSNCKCSTAFSNSVRFYETRL
jgi:hypothetical protein